MAVCGIFFIVIWVLYLYTSWTCWKAGKFICTCIICNINTQLSDEKFPPNAGYKNKEENSHDMAIVILQVMRKRISNSFLVTILKIVANNFPRHQQSCQKMSVPSACLRRYLKHPFFKTPSSSYLSSTASYLATYKLLLPS